MDNDVLLFQYVKPNTDLIKEAMGYDVRKLEQTSGEILSKYAIVLSQYNVFFNSERNQIKVKIHRAKRLLNGIVTTLLTQKDVKKYGTKVAAVNNIVNSSAKYSSIQADIDNATEELIYIDGIDKTVSDVVATLKRELTRREHELYATRLERKI